MDRSRAEQIGTNSWTVCTGRRSASKEVLPTLHRSAQPCGSSVGHCLNWPGQLAPRARLVGIPAATGVPGFRAAVPSTQPPASGINPLAKLVVRQFVFRRWIQSVYYICKPAAVTQIWGRCCGTGRSWENLTLSTSKSAQSMPNCLAGGPRPLTTKSGTSIDVDQSANQPVVLAGSGSRSPN